MANAASPSSFHNLESARLQAPTTLPALYRLEPGDRLDRQTFHERYEAMPEGFRAELVGGTVIVPSPVLHQHSGSHSVLICWLGQYWASTPGTKAYDNGSLFLSPVSEVQPDGMLLILPELGGRIRLENRCIAGSPELVAEVSYSSEAYDLHSKLSVYEEAGVLEYVVILLRERRIAWFVLRDGKFQPQAAVDSVFRSTVFPGLWLDEAAFLREDMAQVLATLQRGIAQQEHAAFVESLQRRHAGNP